ncbi:hypothetical protein, partial [Natronococcus sp.]|uniref:hypothetical protein n=1 Tax=Natronococcus sp. TaxID=35747 RepID=UPI0025FA8D5B
MPRDTLSDGTLTRTTRRAILKAAASTLGVATLGGVASGHKYTTEGPYGDQFDGNRSDAAERTEVVGYHSLGGIGSASMAGSPDDPHYGGVTELRVHDDIAVLSVFSSRDETPGRGMAVLDIGQFTRAESHEDLESAELSVLSFFGNRNDGAACMDVKLSDDGKYAFISKQPFTALFDETELDLDD